MALITYNVSVLALFENDEFTYPYWPDTDTRIRIGAFELLSFGDQILEEQLAMKLSLE